MYGLIAMALIGTGLFILTGVRALRRETDE